MKIILATTSPYRQQAFQMLDIPFSAKGSSVNEDFDGRPSNPEKLVASLAKLKAEAVAKNHTDGVVIGFDSVGWFNGKVLEKPKSREEAFDRLHSLSGNNYQFFTGVHVISIPKRRALSRTVKTEVRVRDISDSEIEKYLDQDQNYRTYAQGYDPLGTYGATFIKAIEGSYNNVLRGIPLETIVEMLKELGYET